jgi:DNA polymerase III subunit epsilon
MTRLLSRLRPRRSDAATEYRRAKRPPAGTPWRQAKFSVVDLETTGLDAHRDEIISFAAVPVDDGRAAVGRTRTATIRPRRMPAAETIRIHGLRPDDLADAPVLDEVIDLILEALAGRVLVAHVAWVERGFLDSAFRPAGLRVPKPVLDTAVLARRVLRIDGGGEGEAIPLAAAADRLGLPVHRPHHADGDALTTAQLFIALASQLDATEPQTVGSLARLSAD